MTRVAKQPPRFDRWLADRWEQRRQPAVLAAWGVWWSVGLVAVIGLFYRSDAAWAHFLFAMVVLTTVTGWRTSVRRSAKLGDAAPQSRRIDRRQAQRMVHIREREARLKRERPADYPPAPWLDDTRSQDQSATAE